MDLTTLFSLQVLALQAPIFGFSFAIVMALTNAGLPSRWSYLAAIGVGAGVGALFGLMSFGLDRQALASALFGGILGVGTQTASRRKPEDIVATGTAKLEDTAGNRGV